MEYLAKFKQARAISTPLVFISTSDQGECIRSLVAAGIGKVKMKGEEIPIPVCEWDIIGALRGVNDAGTAAVYELLELTPSDEAAVIAQNEATRIKKTRKITDMLERVLYENTTGIANRTVIFVRNAQNFVGRPGPDTAALHQVLCNARDLFKMKGCTIVLLGPSITLPPELSGDVLMLDEPFPDRDQIAGLVETEFKNLELPEPEPKLITQAVDNLVGLPSAFAISNTIALNMNRKKGLDLDGTLDRKIKLISETKGLTGYIGTYGFEALGGADHAKWLIKRALDGPDGFQIIVFLDEIEKMFAGTGTDLSGVSTKNTGYFLSEMSAMEYTGFVIMGPAGTGKTELAKAAAGYSKKLLLMFSIAQTEESLVGNSLGNLMAVFKLINAVTGGRKGAALFIATCNSMNIAQDQALPPEVQRRFGMGDIFVDFPSPKSKDEIWPIWMKRYKLDGQPIPDDMAWTGSDIKQCCQNAWRYTCSLEEAASTFVPVYKRASKQYDELRRMADGRFINAEKPGTYKHEDLLKATGRPDTLKKKRMNIEAIAEPGKTRAERLDD